MIKADELLQYLQTLPEHYVHGASIAVDPFDEYAEPSFNIHFHTITIPMTLSTDAYTREDMEQEYDRGFNDGQHDSEHEHDTKAQHQRKQIDELITKFQTDMRDILS